MKPPSRTIEILHIEALISPDQRLPTILVMFLRNFSSLRFDRRGANPASPCRASLRASGLAVRVPGFGVSDRDTREMSRPRVPLQLGICSATDGKGRPDYIAGYEVDYLSQAPDVYSRERPLHQGWPCPASARRTDRRHGVATAHY
jgi:hypothetical protein